MHTVRAVVAHQKANAAGKNVCNGFVSSFGTYLGWTLLRHRSSQAEWSRRPVLRGQASRSVKSLNVDQTNMNTFIETSVGAPENGAPTNSEVSHQNGTADQIGSQPANKPIGKVLKARRKPNIPSSGLSKGRFLDIQGVAIPENGAELEDESKVMWSLDVELEELDQAGNRFVVHKQYNIRGRGLRTLNEDLKQWCGADLIADEDEDVDTKLFAGMQVAVVVENRRQGAKWITTIKSFHPYEAEVAAG